MSNRRALVWALLVGCGLLGGWSFGGAAEHPHVPRHGGQFGDADDIYHYEALLKGERDLILYVNDETNAPLDTRALEARWILNPEEDEQVIGDFTPAPDGAFLQGRLPETEDDWVHVKVEVAKDDDWIGMEFYLEKR